MHQRVREDLEIHKYQRQRDIENQIIAKKPKVTSVETLSPRARVLSNSTNSQTLWVHNCVSDRIRDDLIPETNSNKSLADKIKEIIKIELLTKDSGTKRDYKLGPRVKFEYFYEFFSSELRTNDLLYVIDKSQKPPQNLNE